VALARTTRLFRARINFRRKFKVFNTRKKNLQTNLLPESDKGTFGHVRTLWQVIWPVYETFEPWKQLLPCVFAFWSNFIDFSKF
jgi:hypothetical protein